MRSPRGFELTMPGVLDVGIRHRPTHCVHVCVCDFRTPVWVHINSRAHAHIHSQAHTHKSYAHKLQTHPHNSHAYNSTTQLTHTQLTNAHDQLTRTHPLPPPPTCQSPTHSLNHSFETPPLPPPPIFPNPCPAPGKTNTCRPRCRSPRRRAREFVSSSKSLPLRE